MGDAITFTAEEQKAIVAEQIEEYSKWQNLDEGSLRADLTVPPPQSKETWRQEGSPPCPKPSEWSTGGAA